MKSKQIVHKDKSPTSSVLLFTIFGTTLVTFPFIFDAFTVPKLFVLAFGTSVVIASLLFSKYSLKKPNSFVFLFFCISFLLSITVSWVLSGVPLTRGLLGQFGRGNGVAYYLLAIIMMLLCASLIENRDHLKVHKMMVSLGWILSVYAGLQRVGIDIAKLDTRDLSPVVLTFGNSNFAGSMLAMLFSYHFSYTLLTKKFRFGQISLLLALLAGSTFPAAVQGYLIILFSIAAGLSTLLLRVYKSRGIRIGISLAWFIGILFIVLGILGRSVLSGIFSRPTFQIRIEYWKIAISIIQENPLFGVGPDKLYDYSAKFMAPGSIELVSATRLDNAHNWYLNLGANYGLISLVFFAGILIIALLTGLRVIIAGASTEAFLPSIAISCFSVALTGLVSIEQPGIGIWLYFFSGVLISARGNYKYDFLKMSKIKKRVIFTKLDLAKAFPVTLLILLVSISAILANRIFLDAQLRSSIQKLMVNEGTSETVAKIRVVGLRLKSEPEYAVKSLAALGPIGASRDIEAISRATFLYDQSSIQATSIHAEVLSALKRGSEACELKSQLLENSPWDFLLLKDYLICEISGLEDPQSQEKLVASSPFYESFESFELSQDPKSFPEVEATTLRASVLGRLNFEIGRQSEADKFANYARENLASLEKAQIVDSSYQIGLNLNEIFALIGY